MEEHLPPALPGPLPDKPPEPVPLTGSALSSRLQATDTTPVDVPCDPMGSDRIFETSKSGEFSGFGWGVILFLWENEKKSGAQRPISIFFETWA